MAASNAERQAKLREARKAAGIEELRGVFAPRQWHAELRAALRKLLAAKDARNRD